ncbi:MAG: ribosomal protein P0 (A0) (L10E) [Vezdaea acicularis]|nr:MAG: ribosomal protein P0 (A0) (L10E) [Vezdaea acicularis]
MPDNNPNLPEPADVDQDVLVELLDANEERVPGLMARINDLLLSTRLQGASYQKIDRSRKQKRRRIVPAAIGASPPPILEEDKGGKTGNKAAYFDKLIALLEEFKIIFIVTVDNQEDIGGKTGNKAAYFDKLKALLEEFKSIFIVTVDNVSSQQMHEIRASLRGDGVVLMGKNTMVRRATKGFIGDNPEYERLLPHVKGTVSFSLNSVNSCLTSGNVGFVFTNADLKDTREKILSNKVAAPARAGAVNPLDVYVPAGNTGIEPGKTSFFQALGVPTKIAC